MREILLNIESKQIRCAFVKFNQLQDLIIERKKSRQITGNIYRGRVTNILHNIQSAFVDINEKDNGFIHISDILENKKKFEEMFDMDFDSTCEVLEEEKSPKTMQDINKLLKIDQPVLVQVVKESMGTKGARLTSNISIAGRYLVLLPNTSHRGVSRKIENRQLRDRLKTLIRAFEMPKDMGLICRTASATATTDMLIDEAHDLLKTWETIIEKFHHTKNAQCLYEESDLIKRALSIAVDKKFDRLLIDDYKTYHRCKALYAKYADETQLNIELYRDKTPIFDRFNVENEIGKATQRKVWLSSGGYLFFDRTEAMHTIDINSGRSYQSTMKGDVEEALVRINLEAAEEIARQFRIRNIGGLIICDFIDMRSRKNQKRVLEKLKECMKEDSAKCTILGMSEFGLVEMTRQRQRESLLQTIFHDCPYCSGKGLIKTYESVSIEIERALKKLLFYHPKEELSLVIHPQLYQYLKNTDEQYFQKMINKTETKLELRVEDTLHLNDFQFYSSDGKILET